MNIMRFSLVFLVMLPFLIFTSCTKKENVIQNDVKEETLEVENLTINVTEKPSIDSILGKIVAKSSSKKLVFEILKQNPEQAMHINEATGELMVRNKLIFDYKINPKITASVKVSSNNLSKESKITINVLQNPENPDYSRLINSTNYWITNERSFFEISEKVIIYTKGETKTINNKKYNIFYEQLIEQINSTYYPNAIISSVKKPVFKYLLREDILNEKIYTVDNDNNDVLVYDFLLENNDKVKLWSLDEKKYIDLHVANTEDITLEDKITRRKITFQDNYSIIEGLGKYDKALSCFYNGSSFIINQHNYCSDDFWNKSNLAKLELESPVIRLSKEYIFNTNLISDGGNYIENNITEKGICWSTSSLPTINNNFTNIYINDAWTPGNDVDVLGRYSCSIPKTDLSSADTYYFRSFAKNKNGIIYSSKIYKINTYITPKIELTDSRFDDSENQNFPYCIYDLRGQITIQKLPSSVSIIEKGFCYINHYNTFNKPQEVDNPLLAKHIAINDGTFDNFTTTISESFNVNASNEERYLGTHIWCYVKLDNNETIYSNKIKAICSY